MDVLHLSQILPMKAELTLFWGESYIFYLLALTLSIKAMPYSFCWGLGGVAGAIIGGSCAFFFLFFSSSDFP